MEEFYKNITEWLLPKSYAELMIDDNALGCPLRYDLQVSKRPFVDWETVELYLENMGCFN